jgi:general stress protein YciG/hemerythrin-like domain-containing protein
VQIVNTQVENVLNEDEIFNVSQQRDNRHDFSAKELVMSDRRKRGFAAMSPEKQRAIAQKGGQAAHGKGTAHEFSPEEARRAGHLGGKAVSANRAHMAAIGRKGGTSVQSSLAARARKQPSATQPMIDRSSPLLDASPSLVTRRLHADHQRINGLFPQYEVGEQTQETRATVLQQICQELLHHMELEEDKVYPLVRHALSESEQPQIAASLREHECIKELIRHIEGRTLEENGVRDLFHELQTCVRQHVQEEEQEVLPRAEECLGPKLQQINCS